MQKFRDFDEFADAIEGIAGRFVPTAAPETDWWMEKAYPGRISLQRLQIGSAVAFAGSGKEGMFTLGVPVHSPAQVCIDGVALDTSSFILLKERQPFTFASTSATQWAGVTIPLTHDSIAAEASRDHLFGQAEIRVNAQTRQVEQLKRLICRIVAAGDTESPGAAAARMIEQEVCYTTLQALEAAKTGSATRLGRPRVTRHQIICRALELVEVTEGQPLFTDDLCRATGVSERTLRRAFLDYFGVGPMRLIKVRQLGQIRAALLAADPARGDTVTHVAARFGIWDFSLFARNYKALYGELPSQTLRRAQGSRERRASTSPSWIRYACDRFSCETASGMGSRV